MPENDDLRKYVKIIDDADHRHPIDYTYLWNVLTVFGIWLVVVCAIVLAGTYVGGSLVFGFWTLGGLIAVPAFFIWVNERGSKAPTLMTFLWLLLWFIGPLMLIDWMLETAHELTND